MNHGFFNTTQKVSMNPCTGRAPVHQGKRKHGRVNPNLKQWWSFFSTSEGLFTWIGCLKVRLLTRSTTRRFWQTFVNGWEEEDLKYGRTAHGFFTKTMRWHTMFCLSRRFWRNTRSPCWNIHCTHLTLAPCVFFLFQKIKCALKGTGFEPVDAVKAKAMELVNKLSEDNLQHCFQQWKIRMEWCRDRGGVYIEGDSIFCCVILWIKKCSNISLVIL